MKQLALVTIAILLANCGDSSPTEATVDGMYVGGAIGTKLSLDGTEQLDAFVLELAVAGSTISGALKNPAGTEQIPITGTLSNSRDAAFTATDPCGNARYSFVGSISASGSGSKTISGTWTQEAAANCSGGSSGTFTVSRQS